MRIFKWLKKIRFVVVLLVINMLLSFFIEPANGASARMWSGYYDQEELDMIFVGSSVCQQTFIPEIFDTILGVNSYNMGTPSQAMPQTLRAIEVAVEEHEIKTVVYAMGFSSLKYAPIPEAEITFESARVRQKGGLNGALDAISYVFSDGIIASEKSVNFISPWLYNYEELTMDAIIKNVTEKRQKLETYLLTGEYDATDGLSKGFRNDETRIFDYEKRWQENTYRYYESDFNSEMLAEFETMLEFCNRHELDLIVLNVSHPAFDVIACYESYEQNEKQVKECCEKYGVDYFDFSLAKSEIFTIEEAYFGDYEHLNREGAQVFCQQLCEFLLRRAEGEDMSKYFYSVNEFLELHTEELEEWQEIKKLQL